VNTRFAALYTLLVIVAIVVNIVSQGLFLKFYKGPYDLWLSIIFGTIVGLVVKYILDKRYIFSFNSKNMFHDGRVFVLYAAVGLFTTVVFFGVEIFFDYYFSGVKKMRYLGGIVGLSIGYVIKYQLDKNYVFREKNNAIN